MVVEEVVVQVGRVMLWLQALGLIVLLWMAFQIVQIWLGRVRLRKIDEIKADMKRIEGKIDRLSRKN